MLQNLLNMKRKREASNLLSNKSFKLSNTKTGLITNLPEEVLIELLSFLKVNDLWKSRGVSRFFKEMIHKSLMILDVADISQFKKKSSDLAYLFKKEVIFVYNHKEWYKSIDSSILADKKIVLQNVKHDGRRLSRAHDSLKSDKELVFVAIGCKGEAFRYIDNSLKADKQLVMTAIRSYPMALRFAHQTIRDCEDVVTCALKVNPCVLKYISQRLKDSIDFVSTYDPISKRLKVTLSFDKFKN